MRKTIHHISVGTYLEQRQSHPSHKVELVYSDAGQKPVLMNWVSETSILQRQVKITWSRYQFRWCKVVISSKCCNVTKKNTFSPPDKLAIFFQLFLGGLTLNTTPSEKGSKESTSSSSASPPSVIICRRITNFDQNIKSIAAINKKCSSSTHFS